MSTPETSQFPLDQLTDFLKSGAIYGLDTERVWIGWGESRCHSSLAASRSVALCAIYAPDFYLRDPSPWTTYEGTALVERSSLLRALSETAEEKAVALEWIEPKLEGFAKKFATVQTLIGADALNKGVPVAFAHSSSAYFSSAAHRARLLERALCAPESLRLYGCWSEHEGMIGLSPEILFIQPSVMSLATMALAGTRPASDDSFAEQNFLNNPKERAEHDFVIGGLRESLDGLGLMRAGATKVVRLPTLMHLCTKITVELTRATDFEELASALHPTPALGVSPRAAGLGSMLAFDDPAERGRFGAPFGISSESPFVSDCLVAIRCVQWSGARASIGSGCGLVAASRLEDEWAELRSKRDATREALSL